MTTADLLALQDPPCEVIDGRVIPITGGSLQHTRVKAELFRLISDAFDREGQWWIFSSIPVRIGLNVYRPDIVGWRRENLADPLASTIIDMDPDWVCELLDPSTAAHDRVHKRRAYGRAVGHYWLLDPEARCLETLYLDREQCWEDNGAYDETATAACIAPFEDLKLDLSKLFCPEPMEAL
jgi:Uma2 family endonuclease